MSETNSLQPPEKTTDETRPADSATTKDLEASGHALFERLGIGGMGEVYRCGDDTLQRDLAIKILKSGLRGDADAEQRFLREARLTGSLQHPGIVPVHRLGYLTDGRPCYTMKLVRGRTFADMLRDEPAGPERLPRLLAVVEKVCQAVAFAHSKGVIHRDLKPSNVMVGEFGEVQVMDWGLAKELSHSEPLPPPEATENVETTAWVKEGEGLSRAGSALGTPAYMPSEQAAGDWDIVDERADVFALGAILCEMLTGRPPYHGANRDDLLRRARRGDLAEALGRLEKCGADAVLVDLCRECLAAERLQRPRHAGVVAERLAAYQAEVRERLRQAELERARAEVKALEERKRRRLLAALALMALVLLAGGGGGLWWRQLKRDRADQAALTILDRGRPRLDDGWRLHDLAILREAKAEAERAADIARGGISDAVEQQVADFNTAATERLTRAEKNRELLNALVDIAMPHETKTYEEDEASQKIQEVAEPNVEEQYAAAFRRRWLDIEIEKQAESTVAARLQEEPEVVLQGVIAGLDSWMLEQRRQKRAEAKWRHLLGLVERLDHSEPRRQLRALLMGASPPRAADVAELRVERPPWIALWKLGRGNEWRQLRQLRGRMDVSVEPVLTVLLLAQVSSEVGDTAGAEAVLRQALARRPDEAALLDALGKVLLRQGSSRMDEAIGCYRAIRATHPQHGLTLGHALITRAGWWRPGVGAGRGSQMPEKAAQAAEGEAILRDLVRQQPKNPEMLRALGYGLYIQGKFREAEAAYRNAIALKEDDPWAYGILGRVLTHNGKNAEAEAVYRKAIALRPNDTMAYTELGSLLNAQGKHAEAEAAYRKAIVLRPDDSFAYMWLGNILNRQGKYAEEEAVYRKFIALKPDDRNAYMNLGNALRSQRKLAEAEAAYRKAIALKPDDSFAYFSLGRLLNTQGKHAEEEAAYRKAIELNPNTPITYLILGGALRVQKKYAEAEAAFRKHTALQPHYVWAYFLLRETLIGQGKLAEAEAVLRKAIALDSQDVRALIDIGRALHTRHDLDGAIACYKKAIALDARSVRAHNNLGWAVYDKGRLDEAMAEYRQAIALDPKNAWAHNSIGLVLYDKGDLDGAIACYKEALELEPKNIKAHGNLGNALLAQRKYAEAEAAFRKIIALHPDDIWAHTNLGSALQGQGRFAESLIAYRRGHELVVQRGFPDP